VQAVESIPAKFCAHRLWDEAITFSVEAPQVNSPINASVSHRMMTFRGSLMTFLLNRLARVTSSLTFVAMLGACGGGDAPSSSSNASLPPDKCSVYVNLPGQSTRFNASAFPECTSLRTNADTYLAAAINACVEGNIIAADNYYGRYRQLVATTCPP
jgi:hypothetical protein